MIACEPTSDCRDSRMLLHGARCATSATESDRLLLELAGGRIQNILHRSFESGLTSNSCAHVDLTGFLVLPGLVNAHDHLEFSLFPRMGDSPYRNYIEWGEDIHKTFPEVIRLHRAVPKEVRVAWGGIRNLLSGVTTVSHHNPLHPEMLSGRFPVRVIREYGWAHSPALGGDLGAARAATPDGAPFIVHACEGVDELARQEVHELDRLRLLDSRAVLVHGLALDERGVALLIERCGSLVVCPSSNQFLFGVLPDLALLRSVPNLSLGSDSPLTAAGDLLDEIQLLIGFCRVCPQVAYEMVTTAPAAILRLRNGEGVLKRGGFADVFAVRDVDAPPADRLCSLTMREVELVIIGGHVMLASAALLERLPERAKQGLEALSIDGTIRWLRAPVASLLRRAEAVLGNGQVKLGARAVSLPAAAEYSHAE